VNFPHLHSVLFLLFQMGFPPLRFEVVSQFFLATDLWNFPKNKNGKTFHFCLIMKCKQSEWVKMREGAAVFHCLHWRDFSPLLTASSLATILARKTFVGPAVISLCFDILKNERGGKMGGKGERHLSIPWLYVSRFSERKEKAKSGDVGPI